MASIRKRGRVWYYRYTGADGVMVERKGCPDRRETERLAHHAESEAAKLRDGYIDPKAPRYQAQEARPLADHLADFRAYLIAKGNGDGQGRDESDAGGGGPKPIGDGGSPQVLSLTGTVGSSRVESAPVGIAGGGSRTHTGVAPQRILSPRRLPFRHAGRAARERPSRDYRSG